jgi:membrane-bound lytic murein transglycosylase D
VRLHSLFRHSAALLVLGLLAGCGTMAHHAKAPADEGGTQALAPASDVLPVVTPDEAAVEMVEGSEDAGIVDLVVQEPWPAPADWTTPPADPWSGEGPVEKGAALPTRVSLRFPQEHGETVPGDVVEPAGPEIGPVTLWSGPEPEVAQGKDAPRPAPVGAALDPLHDVGYDMPVEVNEAVRVYLEYFQTRMRPVFARYLIRSGRYIPQMKRIFREYGLPDDLVYVALIESGFNPYAYSRSSAAGPWQFITSTGKRYGLRIDYWVDERRDVELATRAAAHYLTDLYERFGDWLLALAAYNAGEGQVAVALKRTGASTFWELREAYALPQETRDYVPKFMAAAIIAKDPREYGFLVDNHQPMETEQVSVDGPTELAAIARAAEVPLEEIKFLNPQLRRGLTPPDHKSYAVRVPEGSGDVFAANFPAIAEEEHDLWAKKARNMGSGYLVRHKVRRGEVLSTIARKYGARVSNIQRANNMGHRTMIRVGQVLLVPVGRHYAASSGGRGPVNHKVQRGDSLWKIAMRYNVSIKDLMAWNGLNSKSILRPGDRIVVRTGGS